MASVLRESTDASAPVLTAQGGSLNALLKTVLVDGYGTQDPLGWSVLFEDTLKNELVIRADAGTRFPVKIFDDRVDYDYRHAIVIAYESMSTIDNGFQPCPLSSAGENRCIFKSSSASGATPIPWKIIGDNKGFWLLIRSFVPQYGTDELSYGQFWCPHYIGDYTPIDISNKFNFMTLLYHSNGYGYFRAGQLEVPLWVMRDPETQEPGSVAVFAYTWHGGLGYLFGNNVDKYGISPVNGRYLYETPSVWHNNSPIGYIPGFYNMLWRSNAINAHTSYFHQNAEELTPFFDIESDSKKIFVFPFRNSSNNASSNGNHCQRGSILVGEGFRNV